MVPYGTILNAQGIAEGDRKALEREDRKYEEETGIKLHIRKNGKHKMQIRRDCKVRVIS